MTHIKLDIFLSHNRYTGPNVKEIQKIEIYNFLPYEITIMLQPKFAERVASQRE